MSRSVDLPEAVYAALEEAAATDATSPAEWIAARLPQPAPAIKAECEGQPPRTLADEFAGRVGLLSSGRGDLSERVSEIYAEGMVEKHRARQLSASEIPVHLPARTFAALEEAASASGTTPEGWIAANLPPSASTMRAEAEDSPSSTLAERFAALVGGFRSGRGDLSECHSELFADGMVEKRRMGNL